MSLCAVAEVAVHFESFRNIDLFHQGLYHLKARLLWDAGSSGEGRESVAPSGHLVCPSLSSEPAKAKTNRPDQHCLIPAHIAEDSISTRSFLIRYCEEEIEINDIGQFRAEIAVDALESNDSALLIEVELMFADLTRVDGGAERFAENPDGLDTTEFKSVSKQVLRLRNVHRGLHAFCPLVFDEFHFCLANLVVHSSLVDFRFRLPTVAPALPSVGSTAQPGVPGTDAPEGASTASGGAKSSRDGRRPSLVPSVVSVSPRSPSLSMSELLFDRQHDQLFESREQRLQRVSGLYERYMDDLSSAHTRLSAWLKVVRRQCLAPELDRALGLGPVSEDHEYRPAHKKLPSDGGDTLSTASSDGSVCSLSTARQRFSEARAGRDVSTAALAADLVYDMNLASCRVLELWHGVLNMMLWAPRELAATIRRDWEVRIAERWQVSVIKEAVREDITTADNCNISEVHQQMADRVRAAGDPTDTMSADVSLEDLSLLPKMELRPLFFEQRYGNRSVLLAEQASEEASRLPSDVKPYRGVHLVVLVHGFQGNSFDMRLMKNNLALLYPDAIFLCSTCNEDNTEGDITEMGIRLAQEVVNYICDWCPANALGRLSFVAHSMGGLITRAALPLLSDYSSKMFTFLTFSSSHLGILHDKISLFNTGFWVLKQWRKCEFLQQISMTDNKNPKDTFLYKLSKSRGLEFFKNVVLVSCVDDQYGPFQSVRAEISSEWDGQPSMDIYREMVRNIWRHVKPENVIRLDVNFMMPEKNLDTFIGRAAHIQFLECQPIMKMLAHNYAAFFR